MANNLTLPATASVVATEDVSSVHYQKFEPYGAGGNPLFQAEDAASAGGEYGIPILGVRNDTDAAKTGTDGDFGMLSLDSSGRVKIYSTLQPVYGSVADFTCTLASKTSGQGRRSATVDFSALLADDVLVFVSLTPGTITAPALFTVYGYGSFDASNYDTGGSTDADYNTIAGDEKLIGQVAILANTTARGGWFSLAKAYGGIANVPKSGGIIVSQTNCGTLSGTEGNHLKKYVPIRYRQGA